MLPANPFVKVHTLVAAIMAAVSPDVVCKGPTFGSPQLAPGGGTPCGRLCRWPEAVARAMPHRSAVDPQNRVPVDAGRPRTFRRRRRHRFPLSGPART